MASPPIYRFAEFTLEPSTRRLRRGDTQLPLEPKSFRLLELLVANHDRVLEKDEIFRVVWEETIVTDNALTRAIAQIRKALEDDSKRPRFIETLPTVGYRFIGDLTVGEPAEPATVTAPRERQARVWAAIATALLPASVFVAWRVGQRPPEIAASTPVPLTTYRGNVTAPSFSPDGSLVAFQWDGEKQGKIDIYVKGVGPDAVPLRLTTDRLPDKMPSWSPDGSTIAFVRVTAANQGELMLIPALGGPERRLAQILICGDSVSDVMAAVPAWSPNGKWLVMPEFLKQHAALFRISAETGEQEQITEPRMGFDDKFPAISPDGRTLLFMRRPVFSYDGTLSTVRLDENAKPVEEPQPIASHGLAIREAAWMANGKEIAVRTPGGLARIPVRGGGAPQPVPGTGSDVQGVTVSRQGNRLAYSVMHGDANIWRVDLSAKVLKPEQLIASTFRDVSPRYSPDGIRIAFQSTRGNGTNQVWLGDADGRQMRQLTFVKRGLAAMPHWSSDGRTLEFDSNETGSYQIYTMDASGGKRNQLTNDRSDNFGASWSRDGRWLYFTSTRTGGTEVWKMPPNGGTAVQVTHNGGEFGLESEDGKMLYFTRTLRGGPGSIWRMPLAGGPEEHLADSLYRANYAVAKRGIYYMTQPDESGNCTLKLYEFATGTETTVLPMGRPEFGLDISPDGRYLAYAQLDDPSSGLMLIDNFR